MKSVVRLKLQPRSTRIVSNGRQGYTKGIYQAVPTRESMASLSKEERAETDQKKRAASRKGKQFVANTEKAKRAGRAARRHQQTKT